jgi:hypothetical protein
MARSASLKSAQMQTALYYARRKLVKRRNDARVDPVLSDAPSIDGVAEVGETLTVVPGVWDDEDAVLSYVWRKDGALTPIAVGTSYELTEDDLDSSFTVHETARIATGFATASSEAVGPVTMPEEPEEPEEE